MITAAETDGIVELAKGYGSATMSQDKNGDPLIKGRMESLGYSIYFYDCENHKKCKSIQFHAGSELKTKPTLKSINDWNSTKRWARAYLDSQSDPHVEMDIPMIFGIGRQTLDESFLLWKQCIKEFSKHIGYE